MARLLLALLISAAAVLAADPFVGSWKPDVAKWKVSPGGPPDRQKWELAIELAGKGEYRQVYTSADGKATVPKPVTWTVDGQEHKVEGPVEGTVKVERLDDRHFRTTIKTAKGTSVYDRVVSKDGKTLSITRTGTGSGSGRPLDELLIYTKQ